MGEKVLIIGSGGREHALGWKIAQSPEVDVVYHAPGNAGTSESKCRNHPVDFGKKENFPALNDFVKSERIDMVVVGPEAPLCEGIADFMHSQAYHRIFGPSQKASMLEADKFFSSEIMNELKIPQARSFLTHSIEEAQDAMEKFGRFDGVVLKARGLTGGKGVSVFDDKAQASASLEQFARDYGSDILVAERLLGQEFSVFGISDGNFAFPLEIAVQDHKPRDDGDKGPNTGGMGAYCPVPIARVNIVRKIANEIMTPVVQRMKMDGNPYVGFFYAGMMMTSDGPKVLEFNVRMGDPETQPAIMMLNNDLYGVLDSALEGKLHEEELRFKPGAACCVVLASKGYPDSKLIKKGLPIDGLDAAGIIPGVKVFHAGTKYDDKSQRIVTSGGRVLGVTAYAEDGLFHAIRRAYIAADTIQFEGKYCRRDIGMKGLR